MEIYFSFKDSCKEMRVKKCWYLSTSSHTLSFPFIIFQLSFEINVLESSFLENSIVFHYEIDLMKYLLLFAKSSQTIDPTKILQFVSWSPLNPFSIKNWIKHNKQPFLLKPGLQQCLEDLDISKGVRYSGFFWSSPSSWPPNRPCCHELRVSWRIGWRHQKS